MIPPWIPNVISDESIIMDLMLGLPLPLSLGPAGATEYRFHAECLSGMSKRFLGLVPGIFAAACKEQCDSEQPVEDRRETDRHSHANRNSECSEAIPIM